MRKGLWLVLVVAGLLALMAAMPRLSAPPAVRTASASGEFNAGRAKDRLGRVLGDQPPHPADSAASDGVRDRLAAELRSMGLKPRVDDRFACNGLFKQRGVSCARVRNVLVTVGPSAGRHLLINSHYDSVPVGPGASDAGMGVATMLEVASLLKDRPLRRPVTFLFNEGEELGLLGARAFLEGDPLSRQVDGLINLEARGTTGPVNMFETSVPNAAAVRLLAETVRTPVASSLAVSAYKRIPNYTDVNTFEDRKWLTLNFAPIGNETRYHSPGDDLQSMNRATLQHMGDQVLAVSGRLAIGPVPPATGGEWLFMTMAPFGLLTMPMWVGVIAAAGLGIVLLVAVARRRAWLPVPVLMAAVVGGAALAWMGLSVVGGFREGQFWRAQPAASELAIYAGVIAVGLAIIGLMQRTDVGRLRAAFWLVFVAFGAGLTLLASGALVYFVLPPALFALGLLLARWWKPAETLGAVLAAIVLYLTLGGMLGLLEDLLNGGPLWLFAIFGALVLLPWLIEARPLLQGAPRARLVAALASFAAFAWVPAALAPAYSADRQQQWTLQYISDPGQRQPVWAVVNDRKALPNEWRRFGGWRLGTVEALGRRQRWITPAPPIGGLVPAQALPVETTRVPGGRRIRLRLNTHGADSVAVTLPGSAAVRGLGAPDEMRPVGPGSGSYSLTCTGRSCDGQELELLLGPSPVVLTVIGTRWSLPAAAAPLKAAQPRLARAQYLPDATVLVSRVRV